MGEIVDEIVLHAIQLQRLLAENETLEKERLEKFEKNLNTKELADLNSDIKKFNAWSKEPVDKKIIDSIPSIELKDLSDSEIPTVKRTEETVNGVTFVDNDINTYDINFEGPNTMIGSLYLGALRAGEEMAKIVADHAFAERCRASCRLDHLPSCDPGRSGQRDTL